MEFDTCTAFSVLYVSKPLWQYFNETGMDKRKQFSAIFHKCCNHKWAIKVYFHVLLIEQWFKVCTRYINNAT